MASNIEFQTIDALFPVAGIDNNSQGFRDNFSIIRNSLADAKSEVEDLQNNVARKDQDNNFDNKSLIQANLDNMTVTAITGGTQTISSDVNIVNGHYQKYTIGGNVTLTLAGWANANLSRLVVELVADSSSSYTVTFNGEGNNEAIKREINAVWQTSSSTLNADVVVDSSTTVKVFEFWSYDNGVTVYAKYLGDFA